MGAVSTRIVKGRLVVPPTSVPYPAFLARGEGACASHPTPDDFTAEHQRGQTRDLALARAKAACRGCAHRPECLAWALATDAKGVYGATTTAERHAMKAKEARQDAA